MTFRTLAYIAIGILGIFTAVLVFWTARMEHKAHEWEWLHPPEDDDGCSVMEEKRHENH